MIRHYAAPVLAAVLVFAAASLVAVEILPQPLRPVDYFLAGGIGTLVASLTVFLGYARISRIGDLFYKRRRRSSGT